MPPAKAEPININYRFTLKDGTLKGVDITLDGTSLEMIPKHRESYPHWTKLTHSQCSNCPLKAAEHPRCPIAANLVDLIDLFKEHVSYERAVVEVTTPGRKYVKETTLAEGISSLIGIYMVTSGCPILDKLKPMVRTHLPFSTWEETFYRMVSSYLLAQYFLYKDGKTPDWTMKNINSVSGDISLVNQAFCERLQATSLRDAALNAIVQLDCFANLTSAFVRENKIDEFKPIFSAYK
jgi:hypothetical protein